MTDQTIRCWKECPMHSRSRTNACAYKIAMEFGSQYERVTYGEPCRHPEVFRPLILCTTPEGKLEARL